jgi:hypothetical protein
LGHLAEFLEAFVVVLFSAVKVHGFELVPVAADQGITDAQAHDGGPFEFLFVTVDEPAEESIEVEGFEFFDLRLESSVPLDGGGFVDVEFFGDAGEAGVPGAQFDEAVGDFGWVSHSMVVVGGWRFVHM